MRSGRLSSPIRLVLVGWGAIGSTAAEMLASSPIEIVAVGVRDVSQPRSGLPQGAVLLDRPEQLLEFRPDVVAEAAGRASVGPWGHAALDAGADFVVSSVSALADSSLLESLRGRAGAVERQLHIQPGALGGVDALAAARLMGIDAVTHTIVKPPKAWLNTPAEDLCDLESLTEPTCFFEANASQTASSFPKNANVAMTTALAGIGPDHTLISLTADPTAETNRHMISASGAFGDLSVSISNNPLPGNPKTSAMAALNLVRSLTNIVTPIII